MIRYDLKCSNDHQFDGWFASASAFDTQAAAGLVACAICGTKKVEKTIMAPAVRPARTAAQTPKLGSPQTDIEVAMAEMRRQIEENSEYVGMNFVTEARAIHDGTAEERAIYGEAKFEDAKALLEDGIAVAPLPFLPKRQAN